MEDAEDNGENHKMNEEHSGSLHPLHSSVKTWKMLRHYKCSFPSKCYNTDFGNEVLPWKHDVFG